MPFYAYDQNNSGGYWMEPAVTIVVEADNQKEADVIAQANGVDEDAPHCSCCGTRWSLGFPNEYASPQEHWRIGEQDSFVNESRKRSGKVIPLALIVYKDGRKEVLP